MEKGYNYHIIVCRKVMEILVYADSGMKKVKIAVPYVLAVLVSLFVSFPAVSNSVVLDEAYSIHLVRGSVSDIIRGAASDVHPPLYYLILKLAAFFGGESLFKYRIVTALGTYLNLLLVGATLVRRQWGCRVSVLYILWFGLTYGTLEKSTFVRMYSWGAFFVTAASVYLFLYYKNGRRRDILLGSVMTLAAMYTHYYAVMAVFFAWFFLLTAVFLKERRKTGYVILGGVVVTAGYLPWLGKLLNQSRRVAEGYWMAGFDWHEWSLVPAALMETQDGSFCGVGMVLYSFLAILLVLALVRKRWDALGGASVFVCTMAAGGLLSILLTPMWATRYMYVAWGMVSLFAAVVAGEVTSLYSNIAQGLLIVMMAVTGLFSLNTMLADETMSSTADEWVAFLEDRVESEAHIIVDDPAEHGLIYSFYLPDADFIYTEKLPGQDAEAVLSDFLKDSGDHQMWYINDYRQQKTGVDMMRGYLGKMGYSIQSEGVFTIEQKVLEVFRIEEERHGQ